MVSHPKPTPPAAPTDTNTKKSNSTAATAKGKRKRPLATTSGRDSDEAAVIPAGKQTRLACAADASSRSLAPLRETKAANAAKVAVTANDDSDEDADGNDDGDDDDNRDARSSGGNSDMNTHGGNGSAEPAAATSPEEKPKPRRGRRRLLHDEEQRKQRRKNQCKLNQRRYRARQRGMISALSLETDTLNEHIAELEAYERFLRAYTANEAALVDHSRCCVRDERPLLVVDQFVQFFRHGFALHSVDVSELQERFVRFIAAPTLVSQGATRAGVDALLLQLKRYTSYHAVFALHVDACRVMHAPPPATQQAADAVDAAAAAWVVQVSGRMQLRLSRDTVMLVYPHIVADEALSHRVVGHEIDPAVTFVFQFNDSGQVCKLELAVDFAGAFMALLHSAEDVATLLGDALISPHCELGIKPHEEAVLGAVCENKQLSLKFILL